MQKKSIYFNEIIDYFTLLKERIKQKAPMGLLDENIWAENIVSYVVNTVYNFKTENVNFFGNNAEAVDLIDKKNKIIVQVSSTSSKAKINDTLSKKVLKNYHNDGYKLMFVFISSAVKLVGKEYKNLYNIKFNSSEDILDIDTLIKLIKNLEFKKMKNIYEFLKQEVYVEKEINSKKHSLLADIVNILSSQNISLDSLEINKKFDIQKKIDANNLEVFKDTVIDYAPHAIKLDNIYAEYEKQGKGKTTPCINFVKAEYCSILSSNKEIDSDLVFKVLVDNITDFVIKTKNIVEIPYEVIKENVNIIIVNAFIRCKIFKEPLEGSK